MIGWSLVAGLLPSSRVKNALLRRLGHAIARTATIQPIFILGSTHLKLGESVRLGALSCYRGTTVVVSDGAEIGQLNWITAHPPIVAETPSEIGGCLILGPHSSITNRHYLDVSGGVEIGAYSTIAGVHSTFMTHGIDALRNGLVAQPIRIGDYVMLGGSCSVLLGATVPDRCGVDGFCGGERTVRAGRPLCRKSGQTQERFRHRGIRDALYRRCTSTSPADVSAGQAMKEWSPNNKGRVSPRNPRWATQVGRSVCRRSSNSSAMWCIPTAV